jgi:hypothetical protein
MALRFLTVSELDRPIHSGDWHDKPLRWTVTGEGAQTQHFRTKRDAEAWARAYRDAATYNEASREWMRVMVAQDQAQRDRRAGKRRA